jgi:circadian clock protein KaiC
VLEQIDVGEISPGEFVEQVRRAVTTGGSRVVVIDSLNGYVNAMPGQRELLVQLHELLSYLGTAGVLTLMVATGSGGNAGIADIDASYIADSLLLMQHVEAGGHLRRCLSVVKKRHGPHESSVREVVCDRRGMHLGPPLPRFSGLLSSIPTFQGDETAVFDNPDRHRDEGNETNAR